MEKVFMPKGQNSAEIITLKDGEEISVKKEGVYVLRGNAENACVTVDVKNAQAELVLDSLTVVNTGMPVLYVKKADRVRITMAPGSENSLSLTGKSRGGKAHKADALICSRADLIFGGSGRMKLSSCSQAVTSEKNVQIDSGIYVLETDGTAVLAEQSIRIAEGTVTIRSGNDGLHAGAGEEPAEGKIVIGGGTLDIRSEDDCLHAVSAVRIDGGTLHLEGHECIEATRIQINGGNMHLCGEDDAINTTRTAKDHYEPCTEINGGTIQIVVPDNGKADGIDCNGRLIITGGTLQITGSSVLDVTEGIRFDGGKVIINGEAVKSLEKYNTAGRK